MDRRLLALSVMCQFVFLITVNDSVVKRLLTIPFSSGPSVNTTVSS